MIRFILQLGWNLFVAMLASIVSIVSLVVVLSAARIASSPSVQWLGWSIRLDLASLDAPHRTVWIVGGLLAMLLAIFVLAWLVRPGKNTRANRFVLRRPLPTATLGDGELTATVRSIERLITHTAGQSKEVVAARPTASLSVAGWSLDLELLVTSDTALPELSKTLKTTIGDTLLRHTGITLASLRVHTELESPEKAPKTRVQ
jgi:hypothetical protein